MGKVARFLGLETRAATVRTSDPYLAEFFGQRGIGAGAVNPDTVLSNLAVAARCVALRSELLASVPLHLFRRTANGGRERAADLPLYGVLNDMANPNLSAFEFRELLIRSLDLTGNAFARIAWNNRGQVTGLFPLLAGAVSVERLPSGRLRYKVSGDRGGTEILLQEDVLHIRGPSRDGLMGMSPIQIARGSLAMALTQNETAASLFANSLRPSGLLSYPEALTADQRAVVRTSVDQRMAGPSNAGRLMILDGGPKFEQLSLTSADAEFLDARKMSNEDVARIFGMPPTTVGITDKATYSNTEQEARALVQNALGPLAARVEAALHRCLFTEAGRRTLYAEHDLSGILRGDVQARFEAYRIGREIGVYSPNDIRRRENETPIAEGDTYHQPANWVPLGTMAQTSIRSRKTVESYDENGRIKSIIEEGPT